MKRCMLRIIFAYVLTFNCINANEEEAEDNQITKFAAESSSQVPIFPRLSHYDETTAEDQPEHQPDSHRHIKFEEDPPGSQIKFENEIKEDQHLNIYTTGMNTNLQHASFESNQNDGEYEHRHNGDQNVQPPQGPVSVNVDKYDDNQTELENDKVSFSDDETSNGDDSNKDIDDGDVIEEDNDEVSDSKKVTFGDESNAPGRIKFEDDAKKETLEVVSKKRKTRRKPRVHPLPQDGTSSSYDNAYSGYGFPGYPSGAYLSSNYPGPGGPNSGYYPSPGYPVYPITYPTSVYPPSPYPTPYYSGYTPFSGYPGANSAFVPYSTYQNTVDSRPQSNSVGFPGQNKDQTTDAVTKYPSSQNTGQRKPGSQETYHGQEYAGAAHYVQSGYPGYHTYGFSEQTGHYKPYPGYQGYYAPYRRPKSLTQRAISAVTEALTSIALYDDKQCVPRLLCEVASGSTASSPTLLKATASLSPLITVLQSYNGVSTSPLFLFGRAAVLGVTTKGNPTSCRYAYPQCPNDPESLINYLNNHNGGFFRFFGQPENSNKQQNLEQFYNNLSGQYPQQQQIQGQQQQQNQQVGQQQSNQGYYGYPYGYAMQNPYGVPNTGPSYYREQNTFRNSKDKEEDSEPALSNIQERIQNKPGTDALEDEIRATGSKWTFPDEGSHNKRENKPEKKRKQKAKRPKEKPFRAERGGNTLKFPDEIGHSEDNFDINREREYIRQQKGIFFPSNNHFNFQTSYQTTTPVNLEEYVFDYKHNFYVKRPKAIANDDSQTIYIVRGNGDPNHPEIVKVRPGQSV